MITPADIQNKEFTKSFRGYSEEEVDMFLDLITLDLEKLIKENINLKAELQIQEKKEIETIETDASVRDVLVSAKSLMEDLAESSEKRASALIHNAELDAALIIKDAKTKADRIAEESSEFARAFEIFRREYKELLDRQMAMFNRDVTRMGYDRLAAILKGDDDKENMMESDMKTDLLEKKEPEVEEVLQPSQGEHYEVGDDKKTIVNLKLDEF